MFRLGCLLSGLILVIPAVAWADPDAPWVPVEPTPAVVPEASEPEASEPDPASPDPGSVDGPVFQLDLQQQLGGTGQPGGDGSGTEGPLSPSEGSGTGVGNGVGSGGSGLGNGSGTGIGTGSGPGQNGPPGPGSGTGSGPGGSLNVAPVRDPQVTGLIVDARGLDFEPSMSMRLLDPEGNQIYTTSNSTRPLNASYVAAEGTAAYATSQDQALGLVKRIGPRPKLIKAHKTLGYDLIITNQDAWTLRKLNETDGFLDNYAVVVIWDANRASLP